MSCFVYCSNCGSTTYHKRVYVENLGHKGFRCTNCLLSKETIQVPIQILD